MPVVYMFMWVYMCDVWLCMCLFVYVWVHVCPCILLFLYLYSNSLCWEKWRLCLCPVITNQSQTYLFKVWYLFYQSFLLKYKKYRKTYRSSENVLDARFITTNYFQRKFLYLLMKSYWIVFLFYNLVNENKGNYCVVPLLQYFNSYTEIDFAFHIFKGNKISTSLALGLT